MIPVSSTTAAATAAAAPPPPAALHAPVTAQAITIPLPVRLQNWAHAAGTLAATIVMYQALIVGSVASFLGIIGVSDAARLKSIGVIEAAVFAAAGALVKLSKWIDSHHSLGIQQTTLIAASQMIVDEGAARPVTPGV